VGTFLRHSAEGAFYIILKGHELWSTNDLKLDLHFAHPT